MELSEQVSASMPDVATVKLRSELLSQSVVPLFAECPNRRPQALGTGLLVSRAGAYYLISAAHVLDEAFGTNVFFYAGERTTHRLRGIYRSTPTTNPIKRDDDPLDVGVFRFVEPNLGQLTEIGKSAIDFGALRSVREDRWKGKYLLCGFPGSKSSFHAKNRQYESGYLQHLAAASPAWRYREYGLDPKNHVMLPYDEKISWDEFGNHVGLLSPKGLSGSPVWSCVTDGATSEVVAGILIESRNHDKNLVATDVKYAIDIIQHAFEDGAVVKNLWRL